MFHLTRKCLNVAEAFRLAVEYKQFQASASRLCAEAQQGDGHPVLILPAFTAPDLSTLPLRNALKETGYRVYGWDAGIVNMGLKDKTARRLAVRLKEIYESNGRQKVSLVGHSLGGIYARALAREFPDMVRDVITVGTPFGVGLCKEATPGWVLNTIQLLNGTQYSLKIKGMAKRLLTPPSMPTTSIFSKTDGIAGWRACLNPLAPLAENIEVSSSHVGMIWNKDMLTVILDRLAQPQGKWKPYTNASTETPPLNPEWKPASGEHWRFFPKATSLNNSARRRPAARPS